MLFPAISCDVFLCHAISCYNYLTCWDVFNLSLNQLVLMRLRIPTNFSIQDDPASKPSRFDVRFLRLRRYSNFQSKMNNFLESSRQYFVLNQVICHGQCCQDTKSSRCQWGHLLKPTPASTPNQDSSQSQKKQRNSPLTKSPGLALFQHVSAVSTSSYTFQAWLQEGLLLIQEMNSRCLNVDMFQYFSFLLDTFRYSRYVHDLSCTN